MAPQGDLFGDNFYPGAFRMVEPGSADARFLEALRDGGSITEALQDLGLADDGEDRLTLSPEQLLVLLREFDRERYDEERGALRYSGRHPQPQEIF